MTHRDVDEPAPQRIRLGVAGLQRNDLRARPFRECGIRVEALLRGLIELFEVGQHLGSVTGLFEVREQHAELRAPVADVVLSDHAMPGIAQHAHDRVADDGAAQVADVHFLREIRRGVVDDHRLRLRDGRQQRRCRVRSIGKQRIAQVDVDESRAGDLDAVRDVARRRVSRPPRPRVRAGCGRCVFAACMTPFA